MSHSAVNDIKNLSKQEPPINSFMSTADVVAKFGIYHSSRESYFSNFLTAWNDVKSQVFKLELKQEYKEDVSKECYASMLKGDWEKSIRTIDEYRSEDIPLYRSLVERKVDFIRCRSIVFPLNAYTRWELEIYKFNSKHCEQIFCCEREKLRDIFDNIALHDFLVFDSKMALVPDLDDEGVAKGGWLINDLHGIKELQKTFTYIRSQSRPFMEFVPT